MAKIPLTTKKRRTVKAQEPLSRMDVLSSQYRRTIFKGADFSIRATDTNIEHAKHDLVRLGDAGRFMLDDLEHFRFWKYRDCFHVVSFHASDIQLLQC